MENIMNQGNKENYTKRNRFTRMCIGQALLALLDEKEFDKIRVQEIADKSGVSRMTYYQYYHGKTEVLEDYLENIIEQYVASSKQEDKGGIGEYEHILYALQYFDQYASFLLTLQKEGLYSLIVDKVNTFILEQIPDEKKESVYEAYYYAGALLNVFMKWEESEKKVPAEEIAAMIAKTVK